MRVAIHRPPNEYVIIEAPGKIPVTTPVLEPMVAIVGLPLVQMPPDTLLPSVVVLP